MDLGQVKLIISTMLLTAQLGHPGSAPGCPGPLAPYPGGTDFWLTAPHSC